MALGPALAQALAALAASGHACLLACWWSERGSVDGRERMLGAGELGFYTPGPRGPASWPAPPRVQIARPAQLCIRSLFSQLTSPPALTHTEQSHGPHQADGPQVHGWQGPQEAAGHQGGQEERARHGGREEAPPLPPGHGGPARDPQVPEVHGAPHQVRLCLLFTWACLGAASQCSLSSPACMKRG